MSAQQLDSLHLSWIRDTCPRSECWHHSTFKGVKQFALQVKWDLLVAHDAIIANRVQKMFHANKKHHTSDIYHVGDHVYLSTQNLTLPKGRARKLVPKYIGPYKVVKAHNKASTVTLELPLALIAWQISTTFHMGLIQKFVANNDELFPKWDAKSFYDFSQDNEQGWLVEEITSHCWMSLKELEVEVRWTLGDTTWELLASCKDLEALDLFQWVAHPCDLPKCI